MRTLKCVLAAAVLAVVAAGCGSPVRVETIEVKPQDPMDRVKATLQNYVKGQPLGSEVTGFEQLAAEVQIAHPDKGDAVKAGLDDIAKTKGSPKAKAQALLAKLGLDK